MATYHILNGDCLADQLKQAKINQDFIICRECLIDGNLHAANLTEFWTIRAEFIAETCNISTDEYFSKTVSEFEKINNLPDNSEVCLWFENDLFCQTNMWFVISILAKNPTLKIFRVLPLVENETDLWKGFGIANAEKLEQAYNSRIRFKIKDIELGSGLWVSYQNDDLNRLKELSKNESDCFEYLEEVCQAQIDRFPLDKTLGRPDRVVKEIIDTTPAEFQLVFSAFSNREGIYGFGDLQLKKIYDRQIKAFE